MTDYNGWKNYETWNIALWLNNDEGTYNYMLELAQEARDEEDLASKIEDFLDDNNPLATASPSLYQDILGASLRSADLREIAKSFLEE